MTFWPDDINSDEVLSPADIMRSAGEELESRNGKLAVAIQESRLKDRLVLAFEVINRVSKATLNLFEASHRLTLCYPVLIIPRAHDIPEFLRRQYYVPGTPSPFEIATSAVMLRGLQGTPGRYEENNWVCATPLEFKQKLTKLFAEDYVTSLIISLLTPARIQTSEGDKSDRVEGGGSSAEDRIDE